MKQRSTAGRVAGRRVVGVLVTWLVLAGGAASGQPGVVSRQAALKAVFAGATITADRVYLTAQQAERIAELSREDVRARIYARYRARRKGVVVGRAYVDTHVVRTKRESLLVSLDADGRVRRIDITPTPGVFFGASFYTGGSGQGDIVDEHGRNYGVRTSIFDVHAQAQVRGFDFRVLFARAGLDDTSMLNQVLGLEGRSGVAEKMQGGYVQFGYDVLSQAPGAGGVGLTPYLRYEKVDTHTALAAGFTRDPGRNNTYTTFGVELKPIPNIVLKVDHMWVNNAVDSGVDQFNFSVGYAF